MRDVSLIIFTDIDGTLLDHHTYSLDQAREGIGAAAGAGVPLVLCSSKTRAEIEALQYDLMVYQSYATCEDELTFEPFISENGGGIFLPVGYFPCQLANARLSGPYQVIELGWRYSDVVSRLHRTASKLGVPVAGFSSMSAAEIARACGCSLSQAQLAKCREYDEPFSMPGGNMASRTRLLDELGEQGLRCSKGGRFHHVMGPTDKGKAAMCLKRLYERESGRNVITIGLGDSMNDLPLLTSVDIPVIVKNKPADVARLQYHVPGAYVTEDRGPAGWNHAVCHLVRALGQRRHHEVMQ